MLPAAKIHAIQKALAGDILTSAEEDALRACIEDYSKRLKLGNGFKITMPDIVECFEIVYDDVNYMAAGRRSRGIRLLINTGARGYRVGDIPIDLQHPDDRDGIEQPRVPVTIDEILEAMREAS